MMGDLIHLHRMVELPIRTLDELAREHGVEAQVRAGPDLRPTRHVRIPSFRDELTADWREFVSEVRGSPVSHLLVALGAVVGWTALLVAPLWLGWLS